MKYFVDLWKDVNKMNAGVYVFVIEILNLIFVHLLNLVS